MSDLVKNPEDRFSHDTSQIEYELAHDNGIGLRPLLNAPPPPIKKNSFRGVYCFQPVRDSMIDMIPSTF